MAFDKAIDAKVSRQQPPEPPEAGAGERFSRFRPGVAAAFLKPRHPVKRRRESGRLEESEQFRNDAMLAEVFAKKPRDPSQVG